MDKKFEALGLTSLAKKMRGELIDDKPLPLLIGSYVQVAPTLEFFGSRRGYISHILPKKRYYVTLDNNQLACFLDKEVYPLITIGSRIRVDIGVAQSNIKEGIVTKIKSNRSHTSIPFYVEPYGWYGVGGRIIL